MLQSNLSVKFLKMTFLKRRSLYIVPTAILTRDHTFKLLNFLLHFEQRNGSLMLRSLLPTL